MANNFWRSPQGERPSLESLWIATANARRRVSSGRSEEPFIKAAEDAGYRVVRIGNTNSDDFKSAAEIHWLRERGIEDYAYREAYYVFADEQAAFDFKIRWG